MADCFSSEVFYCLLLMKLWELRIILEARLALLKERLATFLSLIHRIIEHRGIASKKDWFTQTLWPVLQKYQLSYVLFWRNAWDKPQEEAYLPGVGDGDIVKDFKKFKKEKKVLFAKDIVKVK